MSRAGKLSLALFVLAIPLFLITNSVTWAVNDLRLYRYGFDRYDVPLVTGIEREGLVAAARQIRGYFNSTQEPLEIQAVVYGEERPLFSQREVVHMRDVKRLIWGVYGVDVAAGIYLLGFAAVALSIRGRTFVPTLLRSLTWGGGLTVGFVLLVGLVALVGFDSLFTAFHQVSFANDFWRLDPRRDYLVMMFPQEFWFDATLFVGMASVAQALVLGGAGAATLLLQRRYAHRGEPPVVPQPSKAAEL